MWEDIKRDNWFWENLPTFDYTIKAGRDLGHMWEDDLYYITSRPGIRAKAQTESWLMSIGITWPTVLICNRGKGEVAAALDLDYYIDDKIENCNDVKHFSPSTRVYLFTQPWNVRRMTTEPTIHRIYHFDEFIHAILGEQRIGEEPI